MRGFESPNRCRRAVAALILAALVAGCRDQPQGDRPHNSAIAAPDCVRERWYGIYMRGTKVGYASTRQRVVEEHGETLSETTTSMTLETPRENAVARMKITATSVETPQGDLRRYSRSTDVGKELQTANCRVAGGTLTIEDRVGGDRQLPWREEFLGPHAWERILASSPPTPGETRSFRALEESYLAIAAQELVGGPVEETTTPTGKKRLRRVEHRVTTPDAQTQVYQLWIDERGTCVKQRNDAADMEMHLLSREEALKPSASPLNLVDDMMVRLATPLANARRTKWVRYRIAVERGEVERMVAACPSQAVRRIDAQTVELVVRAVGPETDLAARAGDVKFADESTPADAAYLKPNHYITADDPRVAALAREAAGDAKDPWELAVALERVVADRMEQFDYSQTFLTAAEAAVGRRGDCSEHAVLLAAVLRARKIPSRVAIGLVYVNGAMGYHMWTEAWINGRWVGLDATRGDGGIAADHIKVAATGLDGGLADPALMTLAQLLGARPRIEVVDFQLREP
ncbi:MAG: transglutaminase family protein [Pirellulales bacterium]